MSSEDLVQAEAVTPTAEKKKSGPRDPLMVRRGIYLSLAGLAPAIICAAVMGAQPIGTLPTVEWIHKAALGVMLAGFVVILFGVMRFDQVRRRWGPSAARDESGAGAQPAKSSVTQWRFAYLLIVFVATVLFTMFVLFGLTFFAAVLAIAASLPVFLLAVYSPRKVRPFFVGAAFPALLLLILDVNTLSNSMWRFMMSNPYGAYESFAPWTGFWLLAHWLQLVAGPLIGLLTVVAAQKLAELEDQPPLD